MQCKKKFFGLANIIGSGYLFFLIVSSTCNFACINSENYKARSSANQKMKTFKIQVYGIVQGVFFRKFTKKSAEENNVTGFARNEPDGSVYIEATGSETDLKNFIAWCHQGPEHAHVDSVVIKEIPAVGFSSFNIKYF